MLERRVNAGSIQAVASYVRAGDACGHRIALYGRPDPRFPSVRFSTELRSFDRVVLIDESSLGWLSGVRLARVLLEVPRERRAILDADGMYNVVVQVDGYDRNHADEPARQRWRACYDALTDRVLQPTFSPLEPDVQPVPFYGYDPGGAVNGGGRKRYDIVHVGHNWWRWREISSRLLPAFEDIRDRVGEICFLGSWWDGPPAGAREHGLDVAFGADPERFSRLRIRIQPAVHYTEVVPAMSSGRVNVMTQRPLFRRLRLLTSKYFEILAADTVPLVMVDADHAESVYGPAGRRLVLEGDIAARLLEALEDPAPYRQAVAEVREHLLEHHSYRRRVAHLVEALSR
jgi:hypothetical protein